jgi:NDP-sugar pyrophosphorylase family protein
MKGIIIAGGFGTRLRPLTYRRPKPLVPVANRPFLEYQVALLRQHGVTDVVFATNYMADQIEAHFGRGERFGVRMQYALEKEPLGTGGAIKNAAALVPDEPVIVFNGDVMMDFDLSQIMAFHRDKQALATITLQEVPSPNPFGVLTLDEAGRVERWEEPSEEIKKRLAMDREIVPTGKDLINAGCYILEPECIARIPEGVFTSIERNTYPQLLAERAAVYGVAPGGYWLDMGRAEQLLLATQAVLSGQVRTGTPGIAVGEGAHIAPTTWINGLTAIGRQCSVGAESWIEDCILMDNVTVGSNARLYGIIVDEGTVIEDEVVITGRGNGSTTPVIAAESRITRGTRLQF